MSNKLKELARQAIEEAEWDLSKARVLLVNILIDGASELPALLEEAIYFCADTLLGEPARDERRAAWQHVQRVANGGGSLSILVRPRPPGRESNPRANVGALASAMRSFDWLGRYRLRGGKPIGDATREDLDVEVEHFEMTQRTATTRLALFRSLRSKLRPGEHVRDRFTNEQLEKLGIRALGEVQ